MNIYDLLSGKSDEKIDKEYKQMLYEKDWYPDEGSVIGPFIPGSATSVGANLPAGGTDGQYLAKKTDKPYEAEWRDLPEIPEIPEIPEFPEIPTYLLDITPQDIFNWTNKQDLLISGANLKTINGENLLGTGNLEIIGGDTLPINSVFEYDGDEVPEGFQEVPYDYVREEQFEKELARINKYLPGSYEPGPMYATNYLQLGYIECALVEWADWSNISLIVSSSFYGLQHWSTHLLTLAQANYIKANHIKVGGDDRSFFYKKDETNKRIYIYASCVGGNGFGNWNTTLQNNMYCQWVEEVVYNVEYDANTWITIENLGKTTYNTLVVNEEKVYTQDLTYKIVKMNGMVFVNIYCLGFKTVIENGDLLFYGLPKPKGYPIFMMFGNNNSAGKTVRCALTTEGQVVCHWGGTDSYGDSANKQFGCMFMYEAA